jgi:hypothetical protein
MKDPGFVLLSGLERYQRAAANSVMHLTVWANGVVSGRRTLVFHAGNTRGAGRSGGADRLPYLSKAIVNAPDELRSIVNPVDGCGEIVCRVDDRPGDVLAGALHAHETSSRREDATRHS